MTDAHDHAFRDGIVVHLDDGHYPLTATLLDRVADESTDNLSARAVCEEVRARVERFAAAGIEMPFALWRRMSTYEQVAYAAARHRLEHPDDDAGDLDRDCQALMSEIITDSVAFWQRLYSTPLMLGDWLVPDDLRDVRGVRRKEVPDGAACDGP